MHKLLDKVEMAAELGITDIISSDDFSVEQIHGLHEVADAFRETRVDLEARRELATLHLGRQGAQMYVEPSTRTRMSTGVAAKKMGVEVEQTENAKEFSSVAKGESIEDTARTIEALDVDVAIIRYDQEGAARKVAEVTTIPTINSGDGKGEHPTQAGLDAYTIFRALGRVDDVKIAWVGDAAFGRTIRSGAKLMSRLGSNQHAFVAMDEFQIAQDVLDVLEDNGNSFELTTDFESAISWADIVYMTRPQLERHNGNGSGKPNAEAAAAFKHPFVMDNQAMQLLRPGSFVMHPLPHTGEMLSEIDSDPRSIYFEQVRNGMYWRMAALHAILSNPDNQLR